MVIVCAPNAITRCWPCCLAAGFADHRDEAHKWNRLPSDQEVEGKVQELRECIGAADAEGIQQAIFALSPISNGWKAVPDQVVEQFLTLLRNENMYGSEAAAYILNYFEFESPHLTARQKSLCIGFLNAHGDQFTHFHSQQVVTELRYGDYVKQERRAPHQRNVESSAVGK